jgi:hypothetical protein
LDEKRNPKRSEIKRFARTNQVVERAKKEKKSCGETQQQRQPRAQTTCPFFLKIFSFFFLFSYLYSGKRKKKVESVFVFAVRPRVNGLVTWRNGRKRREKAENPPTPSSSPYKCEIERKWRNERERIRKKKSQKERKRKKICAHTQHNRGQMLSQTVGSGVREKSSDLSGNRFSVQTLGPQRKKWGRVAAGERPTTATASG